MKPYPKSVLSRMDDWVGWTGIADFVARGGASQPRPLKWFPVIPLVSATAILVFGLIHPMSPYFGIVAALNGVNILLAVAMPIIGPFKRHRALDEREGGLYKDAALFALTCIGALQMMAVPFLLPLVLWVDWPRETAVAVIVVLWLYFFQLFPILLTLHASWHMKEPLSDDE